MPTNKYLLFLGLLALSLVEGLPPLTTSANGGIKQVAEGKYLVNVSMAPIAPFAGETQKMLIGFADINGNLIEKNISVDVAIHHEQRPIFSQQNLVAKYGVLPFDYTYERPGMYELFVKFRLPDEPEHTYMPEDFLVEVKGRSVLSLSMISPFTYVVLSLLGISTLVHALSLWLEQKHQFYSRRFSRPFRVHVSITSPLWLLTILSMIALIFFLEPQPLFDPTLQQIGLLTFVLGAGVMVWHRLLLGRDRLFGINFFEPEMWSPERRGLYQWLRNPIYDGWVVALIGLGLWRGRMDFFILACAVFLLLNLFLAPIENHPLYNVSTQ